jgi:hypothetical protein
LKMATLEHGSWSVDGGFGMISRLHWKEVTDLRPRSHVEDPWSTYHIDICLAACNRPGLRLKKPYWVHPCLNLLRIFIGIVIHHLLHLNQPRPLIHNGTCRSKRARVQFVRVRLRISFFVE